MKSMARHLRRKGLFMIDNHFRNILPNFTRPLISAYRILRLTPNQLTVLAFLISLAAACAIIADHLIAAMILWWLGRLLDGTDGTYARATARTSTFGAHLDILLDMASYSVMVLALDQRFVLLHTCWMLILALYVLCITGALSLGSLEQTLGRPAQDNRGLRLGAGLAEGGETGIAYSIFLILPDFLNVTARLWIIILAITVVSRLILAARILKIQN
jgi:phosphatidylglycerophosphate synthase